MMVFLVRLDVPYIDFNSLEALHVPEERTIQKALALHVTRVCHFLRDVMQH